jgi:preprotein translocase subunit SecE
VLGRASAGHLARLAQLKNATLVVIVFCLLVALVIWVMDITSAS